MDKAQVKVGDVVMVNVWHTHNRVPALVWERTYDGCHAFHLGQGGHGWHTDWHEYKRMRPASAKVQASMKLIRGKERDGFFGSYRYMVLCAASLGVPDTIAAGCRRWPSFSEANGYYIQMGDRDDYCRRKAAASKLILADLKAKYDKALTKQRKAVNKK